MSTDSYIYISFVNDFKKITSYELLCSLVPGTHIWFRQGCTTQAVKTNTHKFPCHSADALLCVKSSIHVELIEENHFQMMSPSQLKAYINDMRRH